jgi:heme exporter protein D
MNWNSAAEFFAMGGYGLYVWGALLALVGCAVIEVIGLRARKKAIDQQILRVQKPPGAVNL